MNRPVPTIPVDDLYDPCPEVLKDLRRRYPRARIRSLGIGLRRSGPDRAIERERVIKVVLQRKKLPRLLKKQELLPRRVRLVARPLGRRVSLVVGLDIEEAAKAAFTFLPVSTNSGQLLILAGYARWTGAGGKRFLGAITASHGLFSGPASPPDAEARLQTDLPGSSPQVVCDILAAANPKTTGLDVALLRFRDADLTGDLFSALPSIWRSTVPASEDQLINGLAERGDSKLWKAHLLHQSFDVDIDAVAYYKSYPVEVTGWGKLELGSVVESQNGSGTFKGGTSGSPIVADLDFRVALGIQSVCLDPNGEESRSLSTSWHAATAWLRAQPGLADLQVFWDRVPLPLPA